MMFGYGWNVKVDKTFEVVPTSTHHDTEMTKKGYQISAHFQHFLIFIAD
ncbi:hypothetical protein Halhy_3082 [Haliscomenobacter hydrossis DSM 1100]|uniref:Uncharacterized protein n=1 Tax=Haliscomenobacter hydrossis (strain ATCC 27775 / DSM 1100 / LMG 10767 / O) TaxID=760192 RepID=F4KPK7_HALH1|nr:hypothetical protein Halhy_3082 [Haliscomenobacter hydrossis DSM 1100]